MKISYRILLINFAIVGLIIGSSAVAFYSVMYNVLTSQQSKYLLNSAKDYIFIYREVLEETDYAFLKIINENPEFTNLKISEEKNIDFIFARSKDKKVSSLIKKEFVFTPKKKFFIEEFIEANPYAIVKSYKIEGETVIYYGRIITKDFINEISKRINAEISLIWNNIPSEISNESVNNKYFNALFESYNSLSSKRKADVFTIEDESADIISTLVEPENTGINNTLKFLVFSPISETADLRSSLKYILIIIGSSGIILSLILSFLFTDKMRKQLAQLSKGTENIKDGSFKNKILIKSKDEIGQLANAFNSMLDELNRNEKAKNEYSEFITLINQNPTLKEISEAALNKIIKTGDFTLGALYLIENNKVKLASAHGINKEKPLTNNPEIFNTVIKHKEILEFHFDENSPAINTSILTIYIKYLMLVPIIYNRKVIAILELGSVNTPADETKKYLASIQEQLAIGLTNATAFVQLENLVEELKILNEDYQKQNEQIKEQNERLIELHSELKEKADELEIQKEKAEESTKLKSQFLASMSHELRTPMNSILGLTELILDEAVLTGKNKERMEVVLKSGRRLMNLINDILDLSKIEAGRMEIQEEEFLLDDLINEVETSVMPLIVSKKLQFKVKRNTSTNFIMSSDRSRLIQLLINLIGNAIKFTEKGFVELHIDADEKLLSFSIVDSGIGISDLDQKIIFEEFRQIDGSTTRKFGGTGLGLAICKRIVDMLNGNISVKSELNQGSVFTFNIPLKKVRKDDIISTQINLEALRKNIKNPVLVIDDDPEVRYTIGQYLLSRGYEVVYAEDGDEGLGKAIKLQPFAITLDVMLPKKDGWNVLKELKENHITKDIPVILISITSDKNFGYGLGAFEYFVKPISSQQLLSAFIKLEMLVKRRIDKITLVDDDEYEFERYKKAFQREDIAIDYIQDSTQAFDRILKTQPDLIILDLIMPEMDGITLSHKLKSCKETKNIPIIISTAKELSGEERNSLNSVVEDITIKSKGHPLDVLKIVRDRINLQEIYTLQPESQLNISEKQNELVENEIASEDPGTQYEIGKGTVIDNETEESYSAGDILIVDDDPDTLFTINEVVIACGYKTYLANNGEESLEILKTISPDLILLDIMMPGMDGFQTIKRIRESENWKNIPVFAVTAKAMIGEREVILKHGFNDFISKPVNAGVLAFKIQKLFSNLKLNQYEKNSYYR